MNAYREKLEAKRERLLNAADRAERSANANYQRADLREEVSGIPLGQPIILGHHSEGRHRRALERADNAMRKSVGDSKRAGDLRARAESVGTGGINAQDPEAITKLKEKLEKLEAKQTMMKTTNRVLKSIVKSGVTVETQGEDFDAAMTLLANKTGQNILEATMRELLTPKYGRYIVAFESFQLTNNNAKIKATKKRIVELEAMRSCEPVHEEIEGVCTYVENPELARIQLFFDGKPPSDVRTVLKSYGFKWAPSGSAWQRHLNNAGRYAAKRALEKLKL